MSVKWVEWCWSDPAKLRVRKHCNFSVVYIEGYKLIGTRNVVRSAGQMLDATKKNDHCCAYKNIQVRGKKELRRNQIKRTYRRTLCIKSIDIGDWWLREKFEKLRWGLGRRFDNPRLIAASHLNILFNQPVLTHSNRLRKLSGTTNECVHWLLPIGWKKWPSGVRFWPSSWVNASTRKWAWELHFTKIEAPTFDEIMELWNATFVA